METKIELISLSKSYGDKTVIRDLNRVFEHNMSCVITGPNGSGKTTLLKLISGLLRPTDGRVELCLKGEKIPQKAVRKHVGLVSPDLNLYDRLTALENLSFFAKLRGFVCGPDRISELLETFQLLDCADRAVAHFSSGMKQRLKFAFAFLHRPLFLLLDEPGAGLDGEGKALVRIMVAEQKKRGIVVIATNEPEEVDEHGQEVIDLGCCGSGSN